MERLTYREKDWVGVHDQTNGVVSTNSQAVHRLAEFEDFMEEQGFKSLEELKNKLYFDKNLILDLEKIRTDKNNPLKPRFYYDENLGNECFPFAFCARPYDHNMSLHSFMKNGVLCAYASEHYDTWCKNTKPIKEMNFNEWAVKFITPLIQENEGLIKKLADAEHEIENYQHELEVYKHNDNKYSSSIRNMANKAKQDKIDFAVEQLKETKIWVDNQHFINARYKCEKKVYADVWNYIDNQIKELKEKKL